MIPRCRILKIEDHEDIVHLVYRQSEGGEGYVTAAVYRGGPVAVKKYKNRPNLWASIQREVAVMTLMDSSPHIVKLVGVFETLNNQANVQSSIVMDFAYNQSLAGLLAATSRGALLSLKLRRRIMYDVCRGLADLHAQGIAHEDLKCENVLLDFGLRARLCDFGLSAHIESPFDDRSSGTAGWRAPEKDTFCEILCRCRGPPGQSSEEHIDQLICGAANLLEAAGYDRLKSDIYSLGLVIQQVFHGAGDEACSSSISAIVQDCLSSDPDARPSCERLIEEFRPARLPYSLFTGMEEKSLENEVERLNVCYNWTGFDDDERDAVKQVRDLIVSKKYSQALDLLHSEASFEEEYSRPAFLRNVFLGVLSFHGCGCEVDLDKANEYLCMAKEDAEEDTRENFLVDFYLSAVMLAKDDPASVGTLMQLSRGREWTRTVHSREEFDEMWRPAERPGAIFHQVPTGMDSACPFPAVSIPGRHGLGE